MNERDSDGREHINKSNSAGIPKRTGKGSEDIEAQLPKRTGQHSDDIRQELPKRTVSRSGNVPPVFRKQIPLQAAEQMRCSVLPAAPKVRLRDFLSVKI